MLAVLPTELEAFVQSEVATGRFSSRDAVIAAAVKQMQQRQAEQPERKQVQEALSEADADFTSGRVRRFENEMELRAFAEEIKSNGRERLAAKRV